MLLIRPVSPHDVDDLLILARKAGKGMTSLPNSKDALALKIQASCESFSRTDSHPHDFFLLVLEDTEINRVIGTASISTLTGARQAFYAYRVMPVTHHSHSLSMQVRSELLHLTNDFTDCSEVGSLFVDPEYRGNGHWLAASRYMLMGQFQHRFAQHVIAELRGIVSDQGHSPFWEAIGRNFFQMEYEEADMLCGTNSNLFITELMPKHPIYTCLLPACARDAIGAPNKASKRAMEFLKKEGFEYENVVDIFDGGPIMRAKVKELQSVRNLEIVNASSTPTIEKGVDMLVSNTELANFRVIKANAIRSDDTSVTISNDQLDFLQLSSGGKLCLLPV